MSLLEFLIAPRADSTYNSERGWTSGMGGGIATRSGESVSPMRAMGLSTYYACIRNISEDVAKLPLEMFRRVDRGKEQVRDHPLTRIFKLEPNGEMSAFSFRELLTSWCLGWGNGYAEIVSDGRGNVLELWPIHPSRVKVKRTKSEALFYEIANDTGTATPFSYESIFHLHGMGYDGITGYSVAQVGAESLGTGLAAQRFGSAFFGNGTHIGGVLQTVKRMKDEARKRLRDSWREAYSGPNASHQTAVLEDGVEYKPTAVPLRDSQFIEARRFQHEEVARWFRMPLSKLQDQVRAQGWSTLDAQNTDYVNDTLMAWLVRWEQEILRRLIPEMDQGIYFAEHEVKGLMRGDAESRGKYYTMRVHLGSMTPNEIRKLENENPIDDEAADKPYMQTSMAPLDIIAQGPQSQTQVAAIPEEPMQPERPPEETPRPEPEEEPEEDRNARVEVLRPLFLDAARRLMRKEAKALENSQKRFGCGSKSPDLLGFCTWLCGFRTEQLEFADELMAPLVEVLELKPGIFRNSVAFCLMGCHDGTIESFKLGKNGFHKDAEEKAVLCVAAECVTVAKDFLGALKVEDGKKYVVNFHVPPMQPPRVNVTVATPPPRMITQTVERDARGRVARVIEKETP